MTPGEFNQRLNGWRRRKRAELEREAHWVTVLVNHYPMRGRTAKSLRVEQLIGMNPEQLEAMKRKRDAARGGIILTDG